MNHDSRFVIGVSHVQFCKNPNIANIHLKTTLKASFNSKQPLVFLRNEYRSTSEYQVKRKQYAYFRQNQNLPFCSYYITIHNIILFHSCTAKVIDSFEIKAIIAMLTEYTQ